MSKRADWEYESRREGWRFFLTIPDRLDPWDVEYIEGIFDLALNQCRRRLKRVTKFDGYEVDEHVTTESLVQMLKIASGRVPKSASEILSITCAIALHCA